MSGLCIFARSRRSRDKRPPGVLYAVPVKSTPVPAAQQSTQLPAWQYYRPPPAEGDNAEGAGAQPRAASPRSDTGSEDDGGWPEAAQPSQVRPRLVGGVAAAPAPRRAAERRASGSAAPAEWPSRAGAGDVEAVPRSERLVELAAAADQLPAVRRELQPPSERAPPPATAQALVSQLRAARNRHRLTGGQANRDVGEGISTPAAAAAVEAARFQSPQLRLLHAHLQQRQRELRQRQAGGAVRGDDDQLRSPNEVWSPPRAGEHGRVSWSDAAVRANREPDWAGGSAASPWTGPARLPDGEGSGSTRGRQLWGASTATQDSSPDLL